MGIAATGYLRVLYQACVGEEFEDTNVIGVVLSLRERRNLLEIWIKDRRESEKLRIGEKLRLILEMDPENLTFFFKEHSKSLEVLQFIDLRKNPQ
jgi:translation initiation factor 4E